MNKRLQYKGHIYTCEGWNNTEKQAKHFAEGLRRGGHKAFIRHEGDKYYVYAYKGII